jgi:hypothetical protein
LRPLWPLHNLSTVNPHLTTRPNFASRLLENTATCCNPFVYIDIALDTLYTYLHTYVSTNKYQCQLFRWVPLLKSKNT